jgi:hypothetical protein
MSTAPSYTDDVFAALGIPSDPEVLKECGILVVDPIDHGEDYPFKVLVRRIGGTEVFEREGKMSELPDLKEFGLELIVFAQILKDDRCLSKILLARPCTNPRSDPTKMVTLGSWDQHGGGAVNWTQFPSVCTELRCVPRPLGRKLQRRINPKAEKRCGGCTHWDKQAGYEEYTKVTHADDGSLAAFGGDRQMWKDISDKEAHDRKIRRLDQNRVGLCLEHDSIIDQDMEACAEWEAE